MSIIRLWNGWTPVAQAEEYARLLRTEIVPGIMARDLPGLADVVIMRDRSVTDGEVGFVTAMRFEDWSSVQAFAGGDGSPSVVPPSARALLSRHDATSRHLDVLDVQRRA